MPTKIYHSSNAFASLIQISFMLSANRHFQYEERDWLVG